MIGDRDWTLPQWETQRLRLWFRIALALFACLIATFGIAINTGGRSGGQHDRMDQIVGGALFLFAVGYIVAYVGAIVWSYKVQNGLHKAGLYRHGPWHIVVAAVILNPFILGLWVPVSVLRLAKRIQRQQARAREQAAANFT